MLQISGVTVEGNQIYNCYSGNLYVSNSADVRINRNWIFANTDAYNKPGVWYRSLGIGIANEGTDGGFSIDRIVVTNNIVERVQQALRYWRSHSGGSIWDMYANLYVGFNTFAHTQLWPIASMGRTGNSRAGTASGRKSSQRQRVVLVLQQQRQELEGGEQLAVQLGDQLEQPWGGGHRRRMDGRLRAPRLLDPAVDSPRPTRSGTCAGTTSTATGNPNELGRCRRLAVRRRAS